MPTERYTGVVAWKRNIVASVVLAAVGLSLDCSSTPAVEPRPNRTHVASGAIVLADGRTLILRGANVTGSQKYAPYFGDYTKDDLVKLRTDWGFNAARFLVSWSAVEPEKGKYDDTYLAALEEHVAWCEAAGLYVVLDMHQDVYGEGFALGGGNGAPKWTCDASHYAAFVPQNPWFLNYLDPHVQACVDGFYASTELRAHYTEAWRRVAKRLAGHAGVLGFDPMNEPAWGSYSAQGYEVDLLTSVYVDATLAVRESAPGWLAFIEPGASRNLGLPTKLTKFAFGDVVYSPHSYDRDAEGGAPFDDKKRDGILANFKALRAEADALDAALWIGEYGSQSTIPGVAPYMDAEYDGAAAVAAGSMYWSYDKNDGGYSLLDASGKPKQTLYDAVVRPYPSRVAGKLSSFAYDEATRALTVTFAPDGSITEPTEIVVPKAVYQAGTSVECGGCRVEEADGVVRAWSKASPIVVRPK